jgi:hypothetical protein
MVAFRGPDDAVILVDTTGEPLGTALNPVVTTGGGGGGGASEGVVGAAAPIEATQIGGRDAGNLLRAPGVLNTPPVGTEYGIIVRDPALIDGTALAQVTGTGTAGTPAAGVVTVQGIAGGTPLPVTGSISATNPSVGLTGAAPPASATYAGASVTAAAPAYTNGQMSGLSLNTAGGLRVDGSGVTQPISAVALPLPAGAATDALQTTGNTSLASIDSKTPPLGQAVSAASVPVVLASDQSPIVVETSPDPGDAYRMGILATVLGQAVDTAGRLRAVSGSRRSLSSHDFSRSRRKACRACSCPSSCCTSL